MTRTLLVLVVSLCATLLLGGSQVLQALQEQTASGDRPRMIRAARPPIVALSPAAAAAAASSAAREASQLVLGRQDVPGLRPVRASVAGALRAVAAATAPVRLFVPARQAQASRFAGPGIEVWSLTDGARSPGAAASSLRGLVNAVRRAGLRPARVSLGERGWVVGPARGRHEALALWRRGETVAAVLVNARSGRVTLRGLARDYAAVLDERLRYLLGRSAWQRALDEIQPDGTVSRATSQKLFALAYTPLPGTRAPAGPRRPDGEGTLAGRQVIRLWPTLSAGQRLVVRKALGVTDIRLGKPRRPRRVGRTTGDPTFGDPGFAASADLTRAAQKWRDLERRRLGLSEADLKLKLVVGETTDAIAKYVLADALPLDESGTVSDTAPFCRIRVTKLGLSELAPLRLTLAHEVFHCLQYDLMTPTGALVVNRRNWLLEGTADWASIVVTKADWKERGAFIQDYLDTPSKVTFARTYDAAGFFGEADRVTGALWENMVRILRAPTSEGSFANAGGASPTFLHSWAPSTYNIDHLGPDFAATKPIPVPATVRPAIAPIWVRGGPVSAAPHTVARYSIDRIRDAVKGLPILRIQIHGGARLANSGSIDTTALGNAFFCMQNGEGACTCPKRHEREPPPPPMLEARLTALALSGDFQATSGRVSVESTDSYCRTPTGRSRSPTSHPG